MKNAFTWFLRKILGAYAALILLQLAILAFGLPVLLNTYAQYQLNQLVNEARSILLDAQHKVSEERISGGPFFVFAADDSLVYSNRGKGRSIPLESRTAVIWENTRLGSVYTGDVDFFATEANTRFLSTLLILLGISFLGSVLAGILISSAGARGLANTVDLLKADIEGLANHLHPRQRKFPILELSQISAHLTQLSVRLESNEEQKKQFLQDISHDIRTPLSALKSQLEAMADGVLDASPERITRLLGETNRMERLLTDMSELFRSEKQEKEQLVYLSDLVRTSIEMHTNEAHAAEQNISAEFSPILLRADPQQLRRAIENLLTNAIKYAGPSTHIHLRVGESERGLELEIRDTGPGVDPDNLERIFQRLFREEFARNSPGSGLGLSIVRAVAQAHQAQVYAENLVPRGFRVIIIFPKDRIVR